VPPIKETQTYVKKIVQEYCGQTIDPAQIKLGQPAEAKVAENQPGNPAQPQNQAAEPPPLDLTAFIDSPAKIGGFMFSEKAGSRKSDPLSIY
jgi:hypothetical protein